MISFLNKFKKMYYTYFKLGINNDEDIENEINKNKNNFNIVMNEIIENNNKINKNNFNIVMNEIKDKVKIVNNIKYKID
tara:strand:- start:29 stop:265 length:237 start_codon:yes stop_codon:yes gene_type:complete